MNVLITSVSKKVPLIKQVMNAAKRYNPSSLVYGGDINDNCIGRYFTHRFWNMPRLELLPIHEFIQYCLESKITVIIPTRDGELSYYSNNKKAFEENNIKVMVSNQQGLEITQDKKNFYEYLNANNFPVINTVEKLSLLKERYYVVKEKLSTDSKNIGIMLSENEADIFSENLKNPIFQPYISGIEYSIDVYVDQQGKGKGVVVRERMHVVNGESQITKIVPYLELEKLAIKMAEHMGLKGHIMFQVIVDVAGNPYIIECNPRFGGASTLSTASGLDSFYWFLLEAEGKSLKDFPFKRRESELTQVRYAKDLIF